MGPKDIFPHVIYPNKNHIIELAFFSPQGFGFSDFGSIWT